MMWLNLDDTSDVIITRVESTTTSVSSHQSDLPSTSKAYVDGGLVMHIDQI